MPVPVNENNGPYKSIDCTLVDRTTYTLMKYPEGRWNSSIIPWGRSTSCESDRCSYCCSFEDCRFEQSVLSPNTFPAVTCRRRLYSYWSARSVRSTEDFFFLSGSGSLSNLEMTWWQLILTHSPGTLVFEFSFFHIICLSNISSLNNM